MRRQDLFGYQLPEAQKIKYAAMILREYYLHSNQHHLSAITFLERLTSLTEDYTDEAIENILGSTIAAFYLHVLYVDYNGTPPDKTLLNKTARFVTKWTGMKPRTTHLLYDLFIGVLEISDSNQLNDKAALILLNQSYVYINEYLQGDICNLFPWETKAGLLQDFQKVMLKIEKSQEQQAAKELLLRQPSTLESLEQLADSNVMNYEQTKKNHPWLSNPLTWKKNPLFLEYHKFVRFNKNKLKNKKLEDAFKQKVLLVLFLLSASKVKMGYDPTVWSNFIVGIFIKPKNSKTYQLSTQAMNEKYYASLTPEEKLKLIPILVTFFDEFLTKEEKDEWDQGDYDLTFNKLKPRLFTFEQIRKELDILNACLNLDTGQLTKKEAFAEFIIGHGIKYGLIVGGTVLFFTFFPSGFVMYLLEQLGVIGATAAGLVTIEFTGVAPKMIVDGLASATDTGASTISSKIAHPIVMSIEDAWERMKNSLGYGALKTDDKQIIQNKKYVSTLMSIPHSSLTDREKEILRQTNEQLIFIPDILKQELNEKKRYYLEQPSTVEIQDSKSEATLSHDEEAKQENPSTSNTGLFKVQSKGASEALCDSHFFDLKM